MKTLNHKTLTQTKVNVNLDLTLDEIIGRKGDIMIRLQDGTFVGYGIFTEESKIAKGTQSEVQKQLTTPGVTYGPWENLQDWSDYEQIDAMVNQIFEAAGNTNRMPGYLRFREHLK